MGLDMYLERKIYVKNWGFMKDKDKYSISVKRNGKKVEHINTEKINYVIEGAGTWRKANAIHSWFVNNVQEGVDDCKLYYVDEDKLKELLSTVNEVLEASKLIKGKVQAGYTYNDKKEKVYNYEDGKLIADSSIAEELLPVAEGFFFGDNEYNEWYYDDLKYTQKVLKEAVKDKEADYYYQASW